MRQKDSFENRWVFYQCNNYKSNKFTDNNSKFYVQYSNITQATTRHHHSINEITSLLFPCCLATHSHFRAILSKAVRNQIRSSNQTETVFQPGFLCNAVTNCYFELASPRVKQKKKKWDHGKVVETKEQQNWVTLTPKSEQFIQW